MIIMRLNLAGSILVVYTLASDCSVQCRGVLPWRRYTWSPSAAFRFSTAASRKQTLVPEHKERGFIAQNHRSEIILALRRNKYRKVSPRLLILWHFLRNIPWNSNLQFFEKNPFLISIFISTERRFITFLRSLSKASFRLNILRLSRMFAALLCDTVATRRLGFFVVDDGRFGERPFGV